MACGTPNILALGGGIVEPVTRRITRPDRSGNETALATAIFYTGPAAAETGFSALLQDWGRKYAREHCTCTWWQKTTESHGRRYTGLAVFCCKRSHCRPAEKAVQGLIAVILLYT